MSVLHDAMSHAVLGWVKPELDETLRQACDEIDTFVKEPTDVSHMRFCVGYLHQVQGTLRMVELYAPALVASEMELLAQAVADEKVSDRDEACATLMRGMVSLPDYLERLQSGYREIPMVLLPLLNEIRSARGTDPLDERALFLPILDRPLPDSAPKVALMSWTERSAKLEAARNALDTALAGWPEGGVPENPQQLVDAAGQWLAAAQYDSTRSMAWVLESLAQALRDNALDATPVLRMAFNDAAVALRQAHEQDGIPANTAGVGNREPIRQLLYIVARSPSEHPALQALRTTFDLDAWNPSETELEHARYSLKGRNQELLAAASGGIKEELLRVSDALDILLRTEGNVASLEPQVVELSNIAETLGMLGMEIARDVVLRQRDTLRDVVNGVQPASESVLLDIAGALLYVDAALDDHASRASVSDADEDIGALEKRRTIEALVQEAIVNFTEARERFIGFIEKNWDHADLAEVPDLLSAVVGALRILELPLAADYLEAVRNYVVIELLDKRRVPSGRQLDTLADVMISLEYYLEALRDRRPNRDEILDTARSSLERLHYWPLPEARKSEPASVASPVQETAVEEITAPSPPISVDVPTPAVTEASVESFAAEEALLTPVSSEETPHASEEAANVSVTGEAQAVPAEAAPVTWGVEGISVLPQGAMTEASEPVPVVEETATETPLVENEVLGDAHQDAAVSLVDPNTEVTTWKEVQAPIEEEPRTAPVEALHVPAISIESPVVSTPPPVESPPAPVPAPAPVAAPIPTELSIAMGTGPFSFQEKEDIDDETREIFLEELSEETENLAQMLPVWKANPEDIEKLRPIRRVFHTLKGSGRMVGAIALGEFSWKIESMLNRVLERRRNASSAVVAMVDQAYALLPQLGAALQGTGYVTVDIAGMEDVAERIAAGEEAFFVATEVVPPPAPVVATPSEPAPVAETTPAVVEAPEPIPEDELNGVPAEVDEALLEVLEAEVGIHLDTVHQWLNAAQSMEADARLPNDALLRAVHTMSGAFSMADVPVIPGIAGTTERYVRRAQAAQLPLSDEGIFAIADAADVIERSVQILRKPNPRIPHFEALLQQLNALVDSVPEVEAPKFPEMELTLETLEESDFDLTGMDAFTFEEEQRQDVMPDNAAVDSRVDEAEETFLTEIPTLEAVPETPAESTPEVLETLELEPVAGTSSSDEVVWTLPSEIEPGVISEEETHEISITEEIPAAFEITEPAVSSSGIDTEVPEFESVPEHEDALGEVERPVLETEELAFAEASIVTEPMAESGTEVVLPESAEDEELPESITAYPVEEHEVLEPVTEQEPVAEIREPVAETETQMSAAEPDVREPVAEMPQAFDGEPLFADSDAEAEAPVFADAPVPVDLGVAIHDASVDEVPPTVAPSVSPAVAALTNGLPLEFSEEALELVDIFVEEGTELLDSADQMLSSLSDAPTEREWLVGLQRNLHTLKGGARMANIMAMGDMGHAIESLLEAAAGGRVELQRDDIRMLERGFDTLQMMLVHTGAHLQVVRPDEMIAAFESRTTGKPVTVAAPLADKPVLEEAAIPGENVKPEEGVVSDINEVPGDDSENVEIVVTPVAPSASSPAVKPPPVVPAPEQPVQEHVRVRADLLDQLTNQAGEMAVYRSRLEQQLGAFHGAMSELERTNARLHDQLRRLDVETEAQIVARYQREQDRSEPTFDPLELDRFSTLQQLSRALAETAADLGGLQGVLDDLARQYDLLLQQQSQVSSELQDSLMQARMVPFDSVVPRLRRVVRQAGLDTGKHVRLTLEGTHGEVDRNVIDHMVGPLEHMLRNSVAHGIESSEQRVASGKPEEGIVSLSLRHEGSEIVLQVADDGGGLNREAIRKRAEDRGLITPGVKLSDADLDALIFRSGFTTSSSLSQLAGRGVGLDVVRNELSQLGGSVNIKSVTGQGTTFTMHLPQTLAVTQAVYVRIGETMYAVPVTSVSGIGRVSRDRFKIENGRYHYGGEDYTLYDLGELVGHTAVRTDIPQQVPLLLVSSGDLRAAVAIDQVVGNGEVSVKAVGPQISSLPGIYGATLTADGTVVVILDMAPLVRRYLARAQQTHSHIAEAQTKEEVWQPLIMVVDDSLTMRKVTSRVLERHNLEVVTARDGVDALEVLGRMDDRVPDLILLDIEMPRMDGYELAKAVRADSRYKGIPIMMITSRTGEKHRQRAYEIGVQRYLGKPYHEADLMRNIKEMLGIGRGEG